MSALASSLLYLLSVNAVACALLAWTDAGLGAMLGWAAAIGVAHAIGERFGEPFAAIDTKRRDRMGVFLGTLQVSVLVIALVLAAASPTPGLLGFLVDVFAGYQLLVTVLLRLTTEPRGLVGQSLALTALACLRGGPLGAWAAASSLALAGVYVALDHHARLLAAHRVDDAPHARGALVRGAAVVLPVALAVGLGIYRVSPLPRPDPPPQTIGDAYKPVEDKPKRELDLRALRALVALGPGRRRLHLLRRPMARPFEEGRAGRDRGARAAARRPRADPRGAPGRVEDAELRRPPRARRARLPRPPARSRPRRLRASAGRDGRRVRGRTGRAARAARGGDRCVRAGTVRPVRRHRRGRAAGRARRLGRARAPLAAPAAAAGPPRPRRCFLDDRGRFARTAVLRRRDRPDRLGTWTSGPC